MLGSNIIISDFQAIFRELCNKFEVLFNLNLDVFVYLCSKCSQLDQQKSITVNMLYLKVKNLYYGFVLIFIFISGYSITIFIFTFSFKIFTYVFINIYLPQSSMESLFNIRVARRTFLNNRVFLLWLNFFYAADSFEYDLTLVFALLMK